MWKGDIYVLYTVCLEQTSQAMFVEFVTSCILVSYVCVLTVCDDLLNVSVINDQNNMLFEIGPGFIYLGFYLKYI